MERGLRASLQSVGHHNRHCEHHARRTRRCESGDARKAGRQVPPKYGGADALPIFIADCTAAWSRSDPEVSNIPSGTG